MGPPLEEALRSLKIGVRNLGCTGKLRPTELVPLCELFEVTAACPGGGAGLAAILRRCASRHGGVPLQKFVEEVWRAAHTSDGAAAAPPGETVASSSAAPPLPAALRGDPPGWRTRRLQEPSADETAHAHRCAALDAKMTGAVHPGKATNEVGTLFFFGRRNSNAIDREAGSAPPGTSVRKLRVLTVQTPFLLDRSVFPSLRRAGDRRAADAADDNGEPTRLGRPRLSGRAGSARTPRCSARTSRARAGCPRVSSRSRYERTDSTARSVPWRARA